MPWNGKLLLLQHRVVSTLSAALGLETAMGNCHIASSETDSNAGRPSAAASLPDNGVASFAPMVPSATCAALDSLYMLGHELGRGQCGVIRSCRLRSSGASFACKSISKRSLESDCDVADVVREVCIMRHLSGQNCQSAGNIARLHNVIEDSAFIHLIIELCHGGDLYEKLVKQKCYSEAHAAHLMKSLLEAVEFCHRMGVIHRDIKPENILLAEDCDTSPIKLADFGLALEFSAGQNFSGMAGSTYYMAPEVLQGEYSKEIDTWSAGVIMYLLLCGAPPFCGATEQRIFKAIEKGHLTFSSKEWNCISSSAKDLITKMLHPSAKFRITPAQALEHPWIIDHTIAPKQNQLSQASFGKCNNAGNYGQKIAKAAPLHGQRPFQVRAGKAVNPDLNEVFVHLAESMDAENSREIRLQNGWTCTVLSRNMDDEILVVNTSREKYLISHDKSRKKLGWKVLS